MSIRSGEVRIVRVCTEHFLSSGRAANTFSLLHKVARCRLVLAGWLHTGMGSPCGSWQGRVSNGAGSGCAPVPCLPSLHLPVSALPTLAPRTIPRSSVRAGQAGCVLTAQTVNKGASRDPGDRREIQSEQCEVSGAVQALPTRALPRSTECCCVTARQKWDFSWIHGQGPPGCSVAPASAKLAALEHLTGSRCCHSHTGTLFHLPKCNLIFLAGKFWLADIQLPTCPCCCSSRLGLTPTGSRGTGTCPRSCSSPGVPRRSWHRRVSASLCCTEGHDAHSPPCLPRVTASPRLGTG